MLHMLLYIDYLYDWLRYTPLRHCNIDLAMLPVFVLRYTRVVYYQELDCLSSIMELSFKSIGYSASQPGLVEPPS